MVNITAFNIGTHISNQGKNGSIFAGNLPICQRATLKSTQDKLDRQQKTQDEIAFWEQQKENLKNMKCSSLEEIAKKLETFHTYENEIAAAKMKYNSEQMWHVMDEAKELGEKIAKAAETLEPKTAEERRKEMAEEALGIDDTKGALTESMEQIQEELEEIQEEIGSAAEQTSEESTEKLLSDEELSCEQANIAINEENLENQHVKYKSIDIFV